MRVIVCGGYWFESTRVVYYVLDRVASKYPHMRVKYARGRRGTPYLVACWARSRGIRAERFECRWDRDGASAPQRLAESMLASGADAVVAFPDGDEAQQLCELARRSGLGIWTPVCVWHLPDSRHTAAFLRFLERCGDLVDAIPDGHGGRRVYAVVGARGT